MSRTEDSGQATADTVAQDSVLPSEDTFQPDVVSSRNVDEFFGDFLFSFVVDERLQLKRIKFPLVYENLSFGKNEKTLIERKEWVYDPVFVSSEYYTVLFNNEEEMEMENSTEGTRVDVQRIQLDQQTILTYYFEKTDGVWMLMRMTLDDWRNYALADFLSFYKQFSEDPAVQYQAIDESLRFVTRNPEDEFEKIEGTLSADQWEMFKPVLPAKEITNICYGQTFDHPKEIVFVKRGISSGMLDILTFTKKKNTWRFASYEN